MQWPMTEWQKEIWLCNNWIVSDDGTITTFPAMNLGFVRYNITLGISTPHFTDEEEPSLNIIRKHGCQQLPICGGSYCVRLCINGIFGKGICVIVHSGGKYYELCVHHQCWSNHGPLFVFRNSVPCHKRNGGNILGTRYILKIRLVDETHILDLFPKYIFSNCNLWFVIFSWPPINYIPILW